MGTFAAESSECGPLHVTPNNDVVGHELTPECVCGPSAEAMEHGDHEHTLYTHHALDGRE